MSLTGARGLARVSQNPRCDLQTAMVVAQVDEIKFYETLTGRDFEGEYGERASARRRGRKFETNLHQNNATELRRILAPRFGYDPEQMYVRHLVDEIPDHVANAHRRRYVRTVRIFADVAAGCEPPFVPHLLIEPQLRLPVGESRFIYVAPDFAIFDSQAGSYIVGEEKSMIVRDGSPDRADLERTRRQAGVEFLALLLLTEQLGLSDHLKERAYFIFASPFGVAPHAPVEERLQAEVSEIRRALETYRRTDAELRERGETETTKDFIARAHRLAFNFQNSCMSSCALFNYCKSRVSDTAQVLGDEAADAFGAETKLEHLYALMHSPGSASSVEEVIVAARIRDAMAVLDVEIDTTTERVSVE